nr:insulinase family protein [Acidobacteriota bacterium]
RIETAQVRSARLNIVPRPGAPQSELRIGHVAAARDTPDYHALVAANMVLGGQFVSRINMNLRENKGYTYGARTSFDFRRGPGPFVLYASVQSEVTVDAILEALGELHAIRGDRPVTPAELETGRAALTRGYPRNFETAEQISRGAAQLALYDLPDDYFSTFMPRVRAVDEAAVTRAATEHIDPSRLLTVIVGDREKVGPALPRLNLGAAADLSLM